MPKAHLNAPIILFVINPISGDVDKSNLESAIEGHFQGQQATFKIFYTTGENDIENLSTLIKEITPGKVVAVGGDGTCNMVGNVLLKSKIPMGILPLGSANGLAKELQIPQQVTEALKVITDGKPKPIDTLLLNQKYLSLHLSDIGMNAQVVERFEKDSGRGFWGYARSFFKEVGDAKPLPFKLQSDTKTIVKTAHMVVIANASRYGTGAVINPKGKIDDGFFEVIFVRPYSTWHLLRMIIPFYTRRIHTLPYIDTFSCKKAVIRNFQKQVIQVDGEVIGRNQEVVVEIMPQSLLVLVPG
jgi:diacylglycerol kinase family enzyme